MRFGTFAFLLLSASIFAGSAHAKDRKPTADERAKIETVLRSQGFTRWAEIEFDDGYWEVDDAVTAQDGKFELKLDPSSFAIVKRERDD